MNAILSYKSKDSKFYEKLELWKIDNGTPSTNNIQGWERFNHVNFASNIVIGKIELFIQAETSNLHDYCGLFSLVFTGLEVPLRASWCNLKINR